MSTPPVATQSMAAAAQYMGNMAHTALGVRGVFGNGKAFKGIDAILSGRTVLEAGGTAGIGAAVAARRWRRGWRCSARRCTSRGGRRRAAWRWQRR